MIISPQAQLMTPLKFSIRQGVIREPVLQFSTAFQNGWNPQITGVISFGSLGRLVLASQRSLDLLQNDWPEKMINIWLAPSFSSKRTQGRTQRNHWFPILHMKSHVPFLRSNHTWRGQSWMNPWFALDLFRHKSRNLSWIQSLKCPPNLDYLSLSRVTDQC